MRKWTLNLLYIDNLTQLSYCTVCEQLNKDNKKHIFSKRFFDRFSVNNTSKVIVVTIGMSGYCTGSNLFTWVPVKLQQKKNLSINDQLYPQIVLIFSAHTRYVR